MIWKLVSYSEISLPLTPYENEYIIGIVENENCSRSIAQIPIKFRNSLEIGVIGNLEAAKVQNVDINLFIPCIEKF